MTMLTLQEIMARDVIAVEPYATLREVISLLIERRITGVPVVTCGQVSGVVSATDVLDAVAFAGQSSKGRVAAWPDAGEAESWVDDDRDFFTQPWQDGGLDELERYGEIEEEHDLLDTRTASEVMTRALHMLPSDTPLHVAARYMLDSGIHRVLVTDDGDLVGVATTTDFMRALAGDVK
jgi:CBS domain-containing protein